MLVLVQLSLRQPVVADHAWHLPPPSHTPALLQSPSVGLLATHRPLGSAVPAATLLQMPGGAEDVPLHVLHRPPLAASAHALLQQTPSVQKPLRHWLALEQVAPFTLRPQVPFAQVAGDTQSTFSVAGVQLILHAPFSQTNPPHDWFWGVWQTPRPSQVEVGVIDDDGAGGVAPTQTEGLHELPSANAQAPLRQAPVVPQVVGSVTAHWP